MSLVDDLAQLIADNIPSRDGTPKIQDAWLAEAILESDLIKQIRVEALRNAGERIARAHRRTRFYVDGEWRTSDHKMVDPEGHASVWLYSEAARIEREEAK